MKLILVRHLESIKNIDAQFASNDNREGLTNIGKNQGKHLAVNIGKYIVKKSLTVKNIYCADSSRAIETAEMIAHEVNANVKFYDDLNSIRHNAFSGLPESEIEKIDPDFIYQLKLYRLGLFNSYQIKHNEQNEKVVDFEKRVIKSVEEILTNKQEEDLKIIILHRSSILATLFHFVRIFYKYPKNYYGYVQVDVGNLCILEIKRKTLIIEAVNETSQFLNQ